MQENLNDFMAFVAVARERNFTRAAAQLGISQSALSRTIRSLEERMEIPLIARTTRSVSLTEAGERLVSAVEPLLTELRSEIDLLRSSTSGVTGTVRITATDVDANIYVWPRLKKLLHTYPKLKIDLVNDYGLSDIVADRFDIGVRLGDQIAQDMIAARISADLSMAVVASPKYISSHQPVKKPQDLMLHNCISLRLPTRNALLPWELKKGRHQYQLRVQGQLIFNNVYQIVDAALDGYGLAYVPKELVKDYVANNQLCWVLEEWFPVYTGLHAFYPSRRKPSRAVELVLEALKAGYYNRQNSAG
ncbi:LysR family transcriptional regulator [Brenneria populi subsp. brevivirga]|uniref:LysR family transcriptional regulator n=1 Tax=Brenneria populi TaxID=1505588 RepID=UPI002E193615|nr:LysR family transcriptional regulator [Brenneria populi subsp. brevivirga]